MKRLVLLIVGLASSLTVSGFANLRSHAPWRLRSRSTSRGSILEAGSFPGEVRRLEVDLGGGKVFAFETGKVGKQADGAVMASSGETIVYATACAENKPPEDLDFTPLKIDHKERFSAAGKTSGSRNRLDGRPAEHEILVCRMIDRPIRPLLDGWTHETQLLSWVLSYDEAHSPDPLAVCAASAALCVSNVPLARPVAAAQVALDADGGLLLNPSRAEFKASRLQLTVAGTEDSVLMVEGAADFMSETEFMEAIAFGHAAVAKICVALEGWASAVGKPKRESATPPPSAELRAALKARMGERVLDQLRSTDPSRAEPGYEGSLMMASRNSFAALERDTFELFAEGGGEGEGEGGETRYPKLEVGRALKKLSCATMQAMVRETGLRCDGRGIEAVRPVAAEPAVLPAATVHGSALFTRGETQALATCTLGGPNDAMPVDDLDGSENKGFYLQYMFPPSSVGEVGRFGGVGRREVGHGNLAERALAAAMPDATTEFPYTVRVESLVTESCGSSSMASVCGGCLALMDAGVPLTRAPIAGVAMGLLLPEAEGRAAGEEPIVLTDILGVEDALGTMDFKVAGDAEGISAFQMDVKCEGLDLPTLGRALEQARLGRLEILGTMKAAMPAARAELPAAVPKTSIVRVPPGSVGKVIGPGGKVIRAIIEDYSLADMQVKDDGTITLFGTDAAKLQGACDFVEGIGGGGADGGGKPAYGGPMPPEGTVFRGCAVLSVKPFGVFLELDPEAMPGLEGLCHVSELDAGYVPSVEAFISVGDKIDVKVLAVDPRSGKLRLSRKAVQADRAAAAAAAAAAA